MFLAPWILLGLIGVGVPILLHRIARTERIKVAFASHMLLEPSEVRDTSKRSIRYWLLLALRLLFWIALVLAFAGPLFKGRTETSADGLPKLDVYIVDHSLSMQSAERWQTAKAEAERLVNEWSQSARRNDEIMLVSASGQTMSTLAGPVRAEDMGIVRSQLASLKPTVERLDYGLLMSSVPTWLTAIRSEAQYGAIKLHIVTDAQQSAAPLRFADLVPPPATLLQIHPVATSAGASNWRIVDLSVERTRKSEERVVSVTVVADASANSGQAAPRALSLYVDGQAAPAAKADVTAQSLGASNAKRIPLPPISLRPGAHRLRVVLDGSDALAQDNTRFAVIEHVEPSVLLLTRDAGGDEAAYFASAIESQSSVALNVERVTPQTVDKALSAKSLRDYSAVVVADAGLLSESLAAQIRRYVDAGGSAFIALGPQAVKSTREQVSGIPLSRVREGELRVAQFDDSHPILRESSGWSAVRFMRYVGVDLRQSSESSNAATTAATTDRVLIDLNDGSPLLIERTGLAGKLLILTTPLDRAWNDLPIHPLFVRFIADTSRYLVARDAFAQSYVVGDRIPTGVLLGAGGQVFDPEGERALALDDTAATRITPRKQGFYEVRSEKRTRWLAVNVDSRESDLTPMSADTIERWQSLAQEQSATAHTVAAAASEPAQPAQIDRARQNQGWLVLLLGGLVLLVELVFANRLLTVRRDGGSLGTATNVG